MKKILVALSGGVDSAVAALLLKEQGYEVSGAYIRTWMNEEMPLADCPAQQDIEDARAVAKHLGIDFEIVNLVNEYREHVVHYLVEGYQKGITPNPDIMCNREMKFGIFQNYALERGFDALATGHYVRKRQNADSSFDLVQGVDGNKDQTYFLAMLQQKQIEHAIFPIGELSKPAVRALAKQHQLPNADKKDSQGICFLGDMNINRFLEYYIDDKPGDIVNADGKVLGQHQGTASLYFRSTALDRSAIQHRQRILRGDRLQHGAQPADHRLRQARVSRPFWPRVRGIWPQFCELPHH